MGDGVIERCGGDRAGRGRDRETTRGIWERRRGRERGRGGNIWNFCAECQLVKYEYEFNT